MRKVVRTNKWRSVLVTTSIVHPDAAVYPGETREIRLAADQSARWNGTYLTPWAARTLANVLLVAAAEVERSNIEAKLRKRKEKR